MYLRQTVCQWFGEGSAVQKFIFGGQMTVIMESTLPAKNEFQKTRCQSCDSVKSHSAREWPQNPFGTSIPPALGVMTTGSNRFFTMLATSSLVLAVLLAKSFLGSGALPATSLSDLAEPAVDVRHADRASNQPTILKPEVLQDEGREISSPRQTGTPSGYREYVGDVLLATPSPMVPAEYLSAPSMNLLQGP